MLLRWVAVLSACVALAAALRVRRADDDDEDIDLTPTRPPKACITNDGRDGMCVHESMCTEDHDVFQHGGYSDDSRIRSVGLKGRLLKEGRAQQHVRAQEHVYIDHVFQLGGVIDENEISGSACPGKWDRCCVISNMTTTETTSRSGGCSAGAMNSCPWCVGLYRDGGKPGTKSPTGLYCGGAVIGSKFVLTSAFCVLVGNGSKLWVQLPGSDKQYAVNSTAKNTHFNSGTREHDTALLALNEDVPWADQQAGACLGLKTPLAGDCVAVGFDNKDQLVFTPMSVTAGSCSEQGSVYDAACGRASGTCSVASGSPVLCPSDGEGLIVAGLVRQTCVSAAAVLGSLIPSADWIREELTKNAIAADRYSISP